MKTFSNKQHLFIGIAGICVIGAIMDGISTGNDMIHEKHASEACLNVPQELVVTIGDNEQPITISKAYAVRSNDFDNVYFIAGRFNNNSEDKIGVWSSNSLEAGGGMIMSIK